MNDDGPMARRVWAAWPERNGDLVHDRDLMTMMTDFASASGKRQAVAVEEPGGPKVASGRWRRWRTGGSGGGGDGKELRDSVNQQ